MPVRFVLLVISQRTDEPRQLTLLVRNLTFASKGRIFLTTNQHFEKKSNLGANDSANPVGGKGALARR
jgi:hypothetical protein